jgi:hypothetical protein
MNRLDVHFSKLLKLPFSPITRWPYWNWWRKQRPQESRRLLLLLAASLRESLEEMRLNPLTVQFLGPMPSQRLRMFSREIYPMVAWIKRQRHFWPNWEVEKIVKIPLQNMLNPARYACCRIHFDTKNAAGRDMVYGDFPCYLHQTPDETEILWGATYRIATHFLKLAFDFIPPPLQTLPVIHRTRGKEYIKKRKSLMDLFISG